MSIDAKQSSGDKIRLAVIGAGRLGGFHAKLAAAGDAFELVAVVDPCEESRIRAAESLGVTALASHGELLDQIDAAVIATPTKHHHAVSMELLAAGKHLLVEKPIAATLDEANEMVAAAKAADVVLQVGHVERFSPALAAAAPHLAEPKYIDAARYSGYTFRSTDVGVVYDLMIHDIDVALSLVGSPVIDVDAIGVSVISAFEDVATAWLRFANGCTATLSASRVSWETTRRMHVWTPQNFVAVNYADRTAKVVRPHASIVNGAFDEASLSFEEKERLKANLFQELLPTEVLVGPESNALADEQTDFAASIRGMKTPQVSGAAGRDALKVADQVITKIQRHQWDGTPSGRLGMHGLVHPHLLKGPHWARDGQTTRRAG